MQYDQHEMERLEELFPRAETLGKPDMGDGESSPGLSPLDGKSPGFFEQPNYVRDYIVAYYSKPGSDGSSYLDTLLKKDGIPHFSIDEA